jgi:uracil-DNA glycosylase
LGDAYRGIGLQSGISGSPMNTAPRLAESIDVLVDRLSGDWRPCVEAWRSSSEGRALIACIDARVASGVTVYPAQVFRALETTPLASTRVVILGQAAREGRPKGWPVVRRGRIPPSLRKCSRSCSAICA